MEPPPGWTPPTFHQRNKVKLKPNDKPEWQNFSWWFNRQFLDTNTPPTSAQSHTGLRPPSYTQTKLRWAHLVENKRKPCKTKPENVDRAWRLLPLADSHTPMCWHSAEGTKLAYYLPQALKHTRPEPALGSDPHHDLAEIGRSSIVTLTKAHKPVTEKKDAKRYGKKIVAMDPAQWKAYKKRMEVEWGAWGRYIFGLWHATGQTLVPPGLAADEVRTAKRATAVQEWYPAFAPVIQAIGRIFQEVDPWAYHVYRANFHHWASKWEFMKGHYISARCCFLSMAVLVNQQVLPHRDGGDVEDGWVIMTVFGDFEGGYLCLPDLGVRVPFQPNDVVIFRSALLEHYITAFKGQRYSAVFFTKATVVAEEALLLFDENGTEQAQKAAKAMPKAGGKNARKRRARKERARKVEARKEEAARLDMELDGYDSSEMEIEMDLPLSPAPASDL